MANRPIKALIGGIQKFSTEDGPGIRTTVFIKGCPLNCQWCHNPELINFDQEIIQMPNNCIKCGVCIEQCPEKAIFVNKEEQVDINRELCNKCMLCVKNCYANALQLVAKEMSVQEVLEQVQQDKAFYTNTGGGLTISGGEMLAQPAFSKELILESAKRGIDVCLDTSGYGDGDLLEEMARMSNVTDILYDMKCIDSKKHLQLTGNDNKIILENLKIIARNMGLREKLQMRMPLISHVNDTDEIISLTADFYRANHIKRVTLLPYHNLGVSKEQHIGGLQETFEAPSDDSIDKIKRYFEDYAHMQVEILGKL
ncbi:glycyl-radical enzyme activating protein [Aminicella lysinilytica]|uniref:Pyruvate formate lyase activating enzyme n=1 Tax=Aminicella lysinilytica TaxID=433323 RepID=A0A4R6PX75_9FIRM|nr:glycyl-radical enzyme activating protein [Aminicella lysinilytica]TDP49840.1 pyruvate formate lyase activating enzyme [Aminicella lysinilytica]